MRMADSICALFKFFNSSSPSWKHARLCIIMFLSIFVAPFTGYAFEDDIEKDLLSSLEQSRSIIISIQKKILSGASLSPELIKLKSTTENIRVNDLLLVERFKLREEKVKVLGAKAHDRHQAMAEGYRKALTEYLSLIDSLTPSDESQLETRNLQPSTGSSQPAILKTQQLLDLLNNLLPKKKRPIIGSLPYKHLNYPSQQLTTAASMTPAYLGGNKIVSPDDTVTAPEAPISTEIATLAQSLNWNPVSIYEYVKNNIDTEWYWGCMKGAEDTLHQKSGNDCDQATLLAALLRASGFPTRYVRGVIEFFPDIERAKNLTGIDDPAKIAEFFQKAGIPFSPVIEGGKIANIRIEHVWVESQIPYSNYRGAIIDTMGKTWLGLATSIKVKGYTYNSAPDILSAMSLSTIRDEYLGLVTAATPSTPFELNQTPLEYMKSSINAALFTSRPTTTYSDYLRSKTLVPEVLNILPGSLQFTLIKATNEYSSIPDELIHRVKLTATDQNKNELFTITLPAYKLSNQQIVISYEPETVQDQEIIDSFGGLGNTPTYLVHLRPVLKVNGERIVVARGGVAMGGEFKLAIDLISSNGTQSITNSHIVGNLSVIGISAQRAIITPSPLAGEGGGEEAKDAARLLYEEAMNYNDRWNVAEDELASLLHLSIIRPLPTVVTLGGVIDVTYLLDTPHSFTWKGVFIDANLKRTEVVTGTQNTDDRVQTFMMLSSLQGSILENRIFEDDFQVQSISTAKLLQIVNQGSGGGGQGSGILTIDKTNIDTLLPTLAFDANIKEDMRNAVNQGLVLRTPDSELVHADWTGIGYIKENPATGESGWMLSGMIAGGMTAWDIGKWNESISSPLSNPYSEPANYDPATAQYIEKIATTDMQDGTAGSRLDEPLQVRVLDSKKNPVKNVQVTFTIKAGGGTFGNDFTNIITTCTAITNAQGIASVSAKLGRYTNNNPTFVWDTGYTYSQQAGENIIDAALASGANLTTPFTALGLPGAPDHLNRLHGNNTWGVPLSFAGFVSAAVEDVYNNPISNITVTFSVADPVQAPDHQCEWTTIDTTHKTYFTETGLVCINNSPTWGTCGDTNKQKLTAVTSHTGAAAEVILGGMDNAIYTVTAIASSLSATFALHTYELYSSAADPCGGANDPYRSLMTSYAYSSDVYGNNINAGKTGTTVPVTASMHYFLEKWAMKDVACGSGTCSKVVGTRQYETTTDFTDPSMTFGGMPGIAQGGGVYAANYQLPAGKNEITVKGTATITVKNTHMSCPNGCNTVDEPLTQSDTTTMTVYGVTVQTQPIPMLLVNESGYLSKDQAITYTIEPITSDYKAMTAYTMIYKDGNIVAQIPTETKGTGTATISRGFQFDPNSMYAAEVILNYGTGVEIRGNRVTIPVAQLRVLTDENIPTAADEIKFSDGSKGSNGTKKYHIAIQSQLWLSSCEALTGRIVTLSTATATMGQPVSTPQNTGDAYAAGYTLAFNHPVLPIGNNLCNVQIVDTLDNGSRKDKFILSNRSRTTLDVGLPYSNIYNTAVIYGGLGNKFWVEVSGVGIALPTEPVGIVILGIDGLRQDVLYDGYDASYADPFGCGGDTCYVRVDDTNLPGLAQIMTSASTIKLKDVTAIFPSITFASWASIFTGKLPNETGVLGNEFFARDLYNSAMSNNQAIPGMGTLPSGMVTLDADGGAFNPGGASFAITHVLPIEFSLFGIFAGADTMGKKMPLSAPNAALQSEPLWADINSMVGAKYTASSDSNTRCDKSKYECRTVSMFNQYARGADWWGTPGSFWSNAYRALLSKVGLHSEAALLDESSAGEARSFINGYFSQLNPNGKRKRFPAVFSVYLPGIDHYAHAEGMSGYTGYFKNKTDVNAKKIVDALKAQDEFDNKIFIITADHGHTAMPTNLTYPITLEWIDESGNVQTQDDYREAEMSCLLKLKGFNKKEVQLPEKANNNLHIWELGELFKITGQIKGSAGLNYAVLAPTEIAGLYKHFSYGAKPDLSTSNVIGALNGPMAHVYVKNRANNSWSAPRMVEDIGYVAELLRLSLSKDKTPSNLNNLFTPGLFEKAIPISAGLKRLITSIDIILIRRGNNYEVFQGIMPDSDDVISTPLNNYPDFSSSKYVKALRRINGMNHPDRSGDIVLLMKDEMDISTSEISDQRFTTGVACKSWHGSLNRSDSYVPLIVAYPGGNTSELGQLINNTQGCNTSQGCDGNWRVTDLIKTIIQKEYSSQ